MAFDYVNSSLLQTNSLEYLKSLANSCQNYSALGHDDYHYKFMIYEYPNGISYYLYCGRLKTNSTAFDTFNIKFKYIDLYYKDDGTTSYTYNNDFKEAPSYSYFSVINSNYLFHCFTDITSDYPMTCPNLLSSSSVDNVSNNSSGGSSSVDFPINTSMFMLIPIMLGVLIFMLFFRWTYHNRGGKDINVKK